MGFLEKNFTRFYWLVCVLVFVLIALRAFFVPFSHDEASTFFFYVQSNNYLPYLSHVYTNNHVLNSALTNLCYHLGGSHRFVLRIPNLLSFLVLCYGVYKLFPHLTRYSSRMVLITFFILTFNFLDFFELCRGYGMSMAFMVLGLAYLQNYFLHQKFKQLVLFSVFFQLALAANLTLLLVFLLLWALILWFQFRNKTLFETKNKKLQWLNFSGLLFWIIFSFYYKMKGVLDSGWGEDYWKVTFMSLMQFIFGNNNLWLQTLLLVIFIAALIMSIIRFSKPPFHWAKLYEPGVFYSFVFTTLVIGIYLQKQLLKVNYPEDRTGLFLYVLFALCLVNLIESIPKLLSVITSLVFFGASGFYFVTSYNLNSFTHYFYHVLPKEFYTLLSAEQEKHKEKITVGGNINREMNYAFMNYRGGSNLNPMDIPPQMRMNCDYYIAQRREKPYYDFFYEEMLVDTYWDHVLLKRKQHLVRKLLCLKDSLPAYYSGELEFFNLLNVYDSTLSLKNCLELDIELYFKKAQSPFNSFLVFCVENKRGETVYYSRALLHWLDDNLSGEKKRLKLTTGPMPEDTRNIMVYIWNVKKKFVDFSVLHLQVNELQGKGVNFSIPKDYYPLIEKVTKKPML
jgi:hypothetical protein